MREIKAFLLVVLPITLISAAGSTMEASGVKEPIAYFFLGGAAAVLFTASIGAVFWILCRE